MGGVGLVLGALAVLMVMWWLAPQFGAGPGEIRAKGLGAVQTLCALVGIILVAEWYFIEQPDAARLKFDQTLSAAPLSNHRALVIIEIGIANVGGHAAEFAHLPYRIFVQQVTPLTPGIERAAGTPTSLGFRHVDGADNWGFLAYRAGGEDITPSLPRTDPGLATVVEPGENENLYYRAVVPCAEGLHVAVSSRFQKPPVGLEKLFRRKPVWWIKQSFLDLTEACAPKSRATLSAPPTPPDGS